MSNALEVYRRLKSSNPFAAARFRQQNEGALRAAEEAEDPQGHAAERAAREEQAAALAASRHNADGAARHAEITNANDSTKGNQK